MTVKSARNCRAALICGVALAAMMPHLASAQAAAAPESKKTQAQLEAEAAAAKAAATADDPAAADDAAAAAVAGNVTGKDIVVTGTSIRGVAPTGTQLITVGEAEIKASGATSVSQVLATIPQIGGDFFNGLPQMQVSDSTASGTNAKGFARPQLRPAPAGSNSGTSTLILLNGARTSAVGVNQSVGNPDTVPPALLERVEVNTDGGSAVYGSDAIGGVINFVTKRKFDGVQVGGKYGWAEGGYQTYDANAIVGKDWGSGSAYISYSYAHQDTLYGYQRPWFRPIDFSTGLATGLNCDTPNVRVQTIAGTSTTLHYYASTAAGVGTAPFTTVAPATGTPNVCANNNKAALANGFNRHNAMASFAQDFGDSVKLTVRSRYAQNKQAGTLAPVAYTATVTSDNPYWRPLTGATGAGDPNLTSYSVLGNFSAAVGPQARRFTNGSKQYGTIAELSWQIDKNWQFRGSVNWDQSKSQYENAGAGVTAPGFEGAGGTGVAVGGVAPLNNATITSPATACRTASLALTAAGGRNATTAAATAALAAAKAACYNPFDIELSDPTLIAQIANVSTIGRGKDKIINFKGVLDGALFDLPGGKVKIALGAEYLKDDFSKGIATGTIGATTIVPSRIKQNVASAFFELNVPLISSANPMPMVRELRLAVSGRYDHYTQFGSTFNPRFGATYKPFDWLSFRGSWGKSFRAPSTIDLLGMSFNNTSVTQFGLNLISFFALDPTRPPNGQQVNAIVLQGTNPNLGPQRGRNWSVGTEITPFRGFRATVTYYRNNLFGAIGSPGAAVPTFPGLAELATLSPTQAQYDAFKTQGVISGALTTDLASIYALYDFRNRNLGNSHVGGIDYSVRYTHTFGFGTAFINASGNIQLLNESQIVAGQPFVSNISPAPGAATANPNSSFGPVSKHRISVQTGFSSGGVQATVTLNHNNGYRVTHNAIILQDKVHAYNVVNLFASYAFQGDNFIERGLTLTGSINNVLDTAPPVFRTTTGQGNGFANGSTIGRLFQLGFTKKF